MRLKSPSTWKTTQYAIFAHLGVSSQTWNNIYGRILLSRLIFVSPPIRETWRADTDLWKTADGSRR